MDKMKTKKSHSEEWLFYIVVPPGIEPGTQGQFIDNVSPLGSPDKPGGLSI